jgi:hypothetical protein
MRKPIKTPKKTLAEAMGEHLKTLADARREKLAEEMREKEREREDEVMTMTHGPNWRTKYPGEPEPDDMKQAG